MRVLWLTFVVLLIDQASKVVVLNTMRRGQSIPVLGDWLRFTFTENPGMAFGLTFGPPGMVTIFALAATLLIVLYLWRVRGGYAPYIASLALILGGALGNIIDRVFYGAWLYDTSLFTGKVVDFIHVNLWNGYIDLPFMAPRYLTLFPIWNVADMAIVGGVVGILFFQRRFHDQMMAREEGGDLAPAARSSAADDGAPHWAEPTPDTVASERPGPDASAPPPDAGDPRRTA